MSLRTGSQNVCDKVWRYNMPGIVGMIGTGPSQENQAMLDLMLKSMLHERFYTSGTYVNGQLGVWLGWVCHEGSFSDCLPVWNEKRDICLIFTGETFADETDIDHLRARGHDFNTEDASYLVHLYEELEAKFW